GYGRVGRLIAQELASGGVHFVVAEQNRERVEELRSQGVAAVAGDAGEPAVLIQAHIARAAMLVVATPDTARVRAMIETARALNPDIRIVLRSHSESEAALLRRERAAKVFLGEHELAASMAQYVLSTVSEAEATPPH
ncbi:MAG TPA: NAD(P)-binding protein, partial [Telluria sp.]|nr:NAD(P)-binding protein [Telluria sp.]